MLWQICVVFLVIYAMVVRWQNRKFDKIAKQISVNMKRVPIIEHAISFLGNPIDRMTAFKNLGEYLIHQYNGIGSLWFANKFLVVLADPADADFALKTWLEKDEGMNTLKGLVGNGSALAPVPIWRPRRKILAPNFGQKTLNSFVNIFSKQGAILANKLNDAAEKGSDVSMFDYVSKYSMDSICETTLGTEVHTQNVANHPVLTSFNKFFDLASDRAVKPWFYPDSVYRWHWKYPEYVSSANVVKEFAAKVIKSKRENVLKNNLLEQEKSEHGKAFKKPQSFVEILIREGDKGLTDEELLEETLVMLLAGIDTSSVAMSFASLLMAKHPHIQDKVYQEIKEVIGDTNRHIDANDLPKLKYLEAVLKESMRLYPPAPFIVRLVDKDMTLPSGVTLIPGVSILIHIWAIHRNPKYWGPDATVFRPERFLEPIKHPAAWMPFSSGPRSCLGYKYAMMSMKTVMSNVIRRYRIVPAKNLPGFNTPDEEIPVQYQIMMKHTDNFKLQLELRK